MVQRLVFSAFVSIGILPPSTRSRADEAEDKAVQAITKLGGKVTGGLCPLDKSFLQARQALSRLARGTGLVRREACHSRQSSCESRIPTSIMPQSPRSNADANFPI
jgi:hypothetical protein